LSGRKVVSQTVESATVAALTHAGEGIIRDGKTVFVPVRCRVKTSGSVVPAPTANMDEASWWRC